jgi:hypothetical protein
MQSFKNHSLQEDAVKAAKAKLKPLKGKQVSFTHQRTGEKVTGEYRGMKSMGGRSYAHVETGKAAHRVPPHHIHQVQEGMMDKIKSVFKTPYPGSKQDTEYQKRLAKNSARFGKTASMVGNQLSKKVNEEKTGADYMKQYPTSTHQHIVHNDDEHHIIKGVKHSQANADKAEEGVRKHAAKKLGMHHNDLEAYGHEHMHKDDAQHFEGKPHVHANMAAYVKHHGNERASNE